MCGIAGFWNKQSQLTKETLSHLTEKMVRTLVHRGPDDEGLWVDTQDSVALGFRRLSILDLSQSGHQPMTSHDGRYEMVFNGEIYNFKQLRALLEKEDYPYPFLGRSDSEVLLAALSFWGAKKTLPLCNGMFALALWDREQKTLLLARDKFGKKPLYYGFQNEVLFFASELKALCAHPGFKPRIDRDALCLYLRLNHFPHPWTIYERVFKLAPGMMLWVNKDHHTESFQYFDPTSMAKAQRKKPFAGDLKAAKIELEKQLHASIELRMVSDVPLGAFLSGGFDSSLVVALMQQQSSSPIETFSIGFTDPSYDESVHAAQVAAHLGTSHREMKLGGGDIMEAISKMPQVFDEPFSDASQIPTFLVAQMAKKEVTVALSGDGGDEAFGGYNRYFWMPRLWEKLRWMPLPLRRGLAASIELSNELETHELAQKWLEKLSISRPTQKLQKLARLLRLSKRQWNERGAYLSLLSQCPDPEAFILGGSEPERWKDAYATKIKDFSYSEKMMLWDLQGYLPGDILTKVDRASMHHSLEVRSPFLDPRVMAWGWSLPLSMKIQKGEGKWIVKQLAYDKVPQKLLERPKMGFGLPIGKWLRTDLKDWAQSLLLDDSVKKGELFDAAAIRALWTAHLEQRADHHELLWSLLMLLAWQKERGA